MGDYKNAMELLVEEEVDRQYRALPPRIASYIKQVELVAYALNQLPSLYATSEKGLDHQLERGRAKYGAQISQAVQRAVAAIRRDPLRTYTPLQTQQSTPLREVLHQIRLLLRNDKIDWETLPTAVEHALGQAAHDKTSHESKYNIPQVSAYTAARESSTYYPSPKASQYIRRGSQREGAKSEGASSKEDRGGAFGWDDPLYNPR